MRRVLTTLLEVAGLGLIVAGIWQITAVAGLIAAGVALILIAEVQA